MNIINTDSSLNISVQHFTCCAAASFRGQGGGAWVARRLSSRAKTNVPDATLQCYVNVPPPTPTRGRTWLPPRLDSPAPTALQTRDQFTTHLATKAKTQQSSDISTTVMIISWFQTISERKIRSFQVLIISWHVATATDEGNSFVLELCENGGRGRRSHGSGYKCPASSRSWPPRIHLCSGLNRRDLVHSGTP